MVRESCIQTDGTIFNKSVQLLAYADNLDIIGRSFRAVEEAFLTLEGPARRMGLVLNEKKTKYMVTGRSTPTTQVR
uniref:Reverse transcriptase domain-containing protein n=1 Tax=Rhodnius prolixus TaxID=13249 RepID=T1HU63_RHOPR